MSDKREQACLSLELVDDRNRKTVVDQIVHGLVHGSLLGDGMAIQSRDAATIRFERREFGAPGPAAGRIEVNADQAGKTAIHCQLWCGRLRWRILARAMLIGALVATVGLLVFGWLIALSAPVAVVTALATDFIGWRRARRQLKRRFETFLSNSRYLDTL